MGRVIWQSILKSWCQNTAWVGKYSAQRFHFCRTFFLSPPRSSSPSSWPRVLEKWAIRDSFSGPSFSKWLFIVIFTHTQKRRVLFENEQLVSANGSGWVICTQGVKGHQLSDSIKETKREKEWRRKKVEQPLDGLSFLTSLCFPPNKKMSTLPTATP